MNKHLGSSFKEFDDNFVEELAKAHDRLFKALKRVIDQDRRRGYPTGQEWIWLVKHAEKALHGGKDDDAAD